jgi:citrate synthase
MVGGTVAVPVKNTGLRNVVVADTRVSFVDGENGRLFYRGYSIADLARNSTYEETAYLLLHGRLPTAEELTEFSRRLGDARTLPSSVIKLLRSFPPTANPMEVLQSAVPHLASHDNTNDDSMEANLQRAIDITAKIPAVTAAWHRIQQGRSVLKPDPSQTHAVDFLRMFLGRKPNRETARDLDLCLVLHADHGFNASTFTARVIASTQAHTYAAVTGALGALSGALHGSANQQVMRMLEEVGDLGAVQEYVASRLDAGEKIFGLGHAVYKVDDPRAHILRGVSEALARRTGDPLWFDLSRHVEAAAKEEFRRRKGRDLPVNVDFYSASTYRYMGFPPSYFTALFAVSRSVGWCAHVIEEKFSQAQPKPELYRPDADYSGTFCGPEGCTYVPLEERTAVAREPIAR